VAYALFFLAEVMHENGPATASALRRLTLDFPDHPLTREALINQANWMTKQGRPIDGAMLLGGLDRGRTATDGKADFVAARAEYLAGRFEDAAILFERASAGLSAEKAHAAALDAAVSRLRAGDLSALAASATSQDSTLRADIELEQALYLTANGGTDARQRLLSFLSEFPDHRRVPEARLALAGIALESAPADPAFARTQLDHPDMERLAISLRGRVVLLRLRIEELARQWASIIPIAEEFLSQNPGSSDAPLVTLKLGEALFRNKDYNAARLKLQLLAAAQPESPMAEIALFRSARAASLGGTPQAQEESLALYDQVIARAGPLAEQAQVRKIRALIDLNRGEAAISFARECLAKLPGDRDDLRQPVLILLAEALFATGKGPNEAGRYEEALVVYTKLLTSKDLPAALKHRLHYLRGLTLEQLSRDGEALDSYYQVLESPELGKQRSPEEWYQFERAAFKGLTLLEARGRWQAAVAFAEKIAGFQGPRSREAAERAKKLRLEHMIWE
jgi:tetratricopeptide (TPR) repeat protein